MLLAHRCDLLVQSDSNSDCGMLLKEPLFEVDGAVLRTQNLAVFSVNVPLEQD